MILNILKKTWDFLRPAALPLMVVALVLLSGRYILSQFRNDRNDFSERMKEIQSIHDTELKKILEAQAAERERHEQNLRQLQQELSTAMAKHEEKLRELEHQKEEESRRLFEKYKNDPAGLAQEVSRVTGIPVYTPDSKR